MNGILKKNQKNQEIDQEVIKKQIFNRIFCYAEKRCLLKKGHVFYGLFT